MTHTKGKMLEIKLDATNYYELGFAYYLTVGKTVISIDANQFAKIMKDNKLKHAFSFGTKGNVTFKIYK